MMMTTRSGSISVILAATLGLCSACARNQDEKPEKPEASSEAQTLTLSTEQQELIGLTTAKAVRRTIRPTITSFGRVIPRLQGRALVTAPVAGRVSASSVKFIPTPGAIVYKGQVLAEVEQTYTAPEEVQLEVGEKGASGAVQEAKAALEAAAAEYHRSERLLQAKIISRKRLEDAKAAWLQAQSRYETAQREQASYHAAAAAEGKSPRRFSLAAPLTGVVVQADITAGQQVDTTTVLFTIADLTTVWVEAPIFEGDLVRVDPQSVAAISSVGGADPEWTGIPIYAGDVIDPLKRSANLLYSVDNTVGRLKLGMSVTVAVPAGEEKSVVMVPEAALLENGNGTGVVYIRRAPTAFTEAHVTIGVRQDRWAALEPMTGAEDAIKEGDDVVVTGASELFGIAPGRLPAGD